MCQLLLVFTRKKIHYILNYQVIEINRSQNEESNVTKLLLLLAMVLVAENFLRVDDIKSDLPLPERSPDYTMTRIYN